MVMGGLIEKIPGGNNQNKQFHWWVELGRKLNVFRISHSAASSGKCSVGDWTVVSARVGGEGLVI